MKSFIMRWERIWDARLVFLAVIPCLLACDQNNKVEEDGRRTFILSEKMLQSIVLDSVMDRKVYGELNLNGKIMADESRWVELFPIVGGNVVNVNVELGDFVRKNETLVIIRSSEVAEFDRQLIDAQSDVLVAQKKLDVKRDLFYSKLISEGEWVAAQKELEKAEAALKRIQETFSIYNFNEHSEYHLKAPISGFIIKKNISRDMILPSSHTESVFTIAELSEVWAVANVYESDISRIREGMEVKVSTVSYPNEVIGGRIDKIFNLLDPRTKTMKVRIRIPNPDFKLKPEMAATVKVLYTEEKTLPAVPRSAVIFDNSRQFVVLFKDRYNVEIREVEIYKSAGNLTWLTSGVNQGDVVISHNQLFIYDALKY